MKRVLLLVIASLAFCGSIFAQHPTSHWDGQFQYTDYEAQGALYASIMINGEPVTTATDGWDVMEVAAFVDGQLRMVGMFLTDEWLDWDLFPTLNAEPIYYTTPGEEVSFMMYNHATGVLYEVCETVIWDGDPISILTGEEHWEGLDDPDHPLMLNFTNPIPPTQTHWTYNADATYYMTLTLTGVLYLDGESMQNNPRSEYLEIGAFCGDECRGAFLATLNPAPFAQGYFYLMLIYSEVQSGETLTFRIWDHEAGEELDVTCTSNTTFEADDGVGNLMYPYQLEFVTDSSSSYTITACAQPAEGGTVSGAGQYDLNSTCTLTATASTGYVFMNWTENGQVVSSDAEYTFIVAGDRNLVAQFRSDSAIVFADANVKALCVANWDTDGDGELSYAEASEVTSLGEVFRNKYSISSFDELQYFTGLTSIGNYAFYYCYNLSSIELPNSVTSIGYYAFYYCYNLSSIELPNSVTSIGYYAFSYCNSLTSIELPSSLTSIGDRAWGDCNSLTSIELPSSVNYLGTNPFAGCSNLEQIMVDSDNPYYDSRENCNAIINTSTNALVTGCKNTVIPSSVTSIGNYAFYNCNNLTSIELPDSITSIGSYAFHDCYNLTSIELPNSITSIGYGTFSYCSGLTSIELPSSLTSIGNSAFYNCYNLTSIELPSSLTSIGNSAFSYCTGLTSITSLAETPPYLYDNAFYVVPTNIPVYVPCDTEENYQATNGWSNFSNITGLCSGEVTVTVNPFEGGTVTGAGYYSGGEVCVLTATSNQGFAFSNWTENGRVISMDSVYSFYAHPTTIVANFSSNNPIVFADANVKALCVANWDTDGDEELSYAEAALVTDLGDVFMYNGSISSFNELQYFISLTSIGSEAFSDCYNLTSIELPSSITSIGYGAFSYCSGLTSIELPDSVTSVDSDAFLDCYNLTSIALPSSLTTIGDWAWGYCNSLTSIELPSSVIYLGTNPFAGCSNLEQIIVDSDNPYFDSRGNCNAIINTSTNALVIGCKNTVIPSSVASIGNEAFYDCYSLTSIELPSSVTSIGSYAFHDCYNLTSIELPNSITSIGYGTFSYCSGLTSIELPSSLTSIGSEAFHNCYNLTSIELPSSLTSIGDWAFGDCTGLASIASFAETPPYSYDYSFANVSTNIPIYVPCGVSEDYQYASGWNVFANFYEMCPSNHWTAESYQNSMFMIGNVMIDGVEQVSPILELGAFCNDECRGSALPVLDGGQWLYFMTIDGNSGDDITFRLYDHAIQQELNYYCFNVIPFEIYGLIGIDEPYEVQFASTLSVSVDVNPENAGTVEGTGEYAIGEDVTLTATANEGYLFNSWTLDGEIVSTEPSYSFTVTKPVSLMANFDVLYSVLVDVNLEGSGVVTGEGEYLSGTEVTLSATANEGYVFKNWTLNGEVVSTEPTYTFTVTGAVNLTANFDVVQTYQLAAGENWWSTYLEITLDDLKAALVEALPNTVITIKSKGQNTKYNNGRWSGQLTSLDPTQMYCISVSTACEITVKGTPINYAEHPVTIIGNGITWLGFPLSENMFISDALAGFPVVNGDIIKSKTNNAIYNRGAWRGALTTFESGKGYKFLSNGMEDRTLTFPAGTK